MHVFHDGLMIQLTDVTKKFGEFTAIDDLTLTINDSEITGLLGPNGAGKTTTMRLITGYLFPDNGSVEIDGKDFQSHELELKHLIGYMPESNPLYKELLVCEMLELTLNIYGIDEGRADKISSVVEATNLAEVYYRPIDQLSKGFKQRVGLAQALITDPKILVLDEPTEGLDPNQRAEIRKLIRKLAESRVVIVSTHVMQEVEALCDRIVIINNGKVIADGNKKDIMEQGEGHARYHVELVKPSPGDRKIIEELSSVSKVNVTGSKYEVFVTSKDRFVTDFSKAMVAKKWKLKQLIPAGDSLEDIFYQLTTDASRDN